MRTLCCKFLSLANLMIHVIAISCTLPTAIITVVSPESFKFLLFPCLLKHQTHTFQNMLLVSYHCHSKGIWQAPADQVQLSASCEYSFLLPSQQPQDRKEPMERRGQATRSDPSRHQLNSRGLSPATWCQDQGLDHFPKLLLESIKMEQIANALKTTWVLLHVSNLAGHSLVSRRLSGLLTRVAFRVTRWNAGVN